MARPVIIPGDREISAVIDIPGEAAANCVVACPPHPQFGGTRSDPRLTAVSDELVARGIACVRFDYGPWSEGAGEQRDSEKTVTWVRETYQNVGLFGYSFGGCVALIAANTLKVRAVSALAPISRLPVGTDAVKALNEFRGRVQIIYGERDTTANWEPIVETAQPRNADLEALPSDHFFLNHHHDIATLVTSFFVETLNGTYDESTEW